MYIYIHTYVRHICISTYIHIYIAEAKEESNALEDKGGGKKNDTADVGVSLCYSLRRNLEETYIYICVCVYIYICVCVYIYGSG